MHAMALPELEPSSRGSFRLEGRVTMHNSVMGTQSGDFLLLSAPVYGTRLEVMGPAGTPFMFALISGKRFEAYVVPDRMMVRDDVEAVMTAANHNLIALLATAFAGIASWAGGFPEGGLWAPEPITGGYLAYSGDHAIQWIEQDGQLAMMVIKAGDIPVYVTPSAGKRFLVHFGDGIPIVSLTIDDFDPEADLKGVRWQIKVPPDTKYSSFSDFLQPSP